MYFKLSVQKVLRFTKLLQIKNDAELFRYSDCFDIFAKIQIGQKHLMKDSKQFISLTDLENLMSHVSLNVCLHNLNCKQSYVRSLNNGQRPNKISIGRILKCALRLSIKWCCKSVTGVGIE